MGHIRVQLEGLPLIQDTHVDVAVRAMVDALHGKLWAAEQRQHKLLHEVRVAARKELEQTVRAMEKSHKEALDAKQSEVDKLQRKLVEHEHQSKIAMHWRRASSKGVAKTEM
eukprot:2665299-Prymnesium_polylepis.1